MRKKNRRTLLYLFLGVGSILLVGRFLLSERAIEHIASYFMYPVLIAQNKVVIPIKSYFEKKRTVDELAMAVKSLQEEKENLIADNIQLQSLINYMSQTQDISDFNKQYQLPQAKLAQILVKHFSDQSHYILIDKGLNDGIVQNMVAIYKNCLLGKVIEVYPHYSKVVLITDRACKVAAFCPHTRASGIHQGSNQESQTSLHFVSHLSEVDPEDLVLSSGDGLIFPKGFALGRIKSCNPHGLFYEVNIEPFLDIRTIKYCYIMQKSGNNEASDQALIEHAEEYVAHMIHENHEKEMYAEFAQMKKQEQLISERIAMLQIEQSKTLTHIDESEVLH